MLDGFRSRWTTPASCTATSPSERAAPIAATSAAASGPSLGDLVVQGGPGHVLRGEPRPVRLQIRGDQPGRAAAPDPPRRRHLAREPRPELLVLRQIRPDHLQRDPLTAPVGTQVDDAHAARAEPSVQPERADDTRVLAPEPHHRHLHPRCPVRMTCHSLRFPDRVRAEAAPSPPARLSAPVGKREGWSVPGRGHLPLAGEKRTPAGQGRNREFALRAKHRPPDDEAPAVRDGRGFGVWTILGLNQ